METIIYSQVHQLVNRIPKTKLSHAYRLLLELTDKDDEALSPQSDFIRLTPSEKRRILAQQAEQMKAHYERNADERDEWQSGDFVNEY